jgi:hypothetical protein
MNDFGYDEDVFVQLMEFIAPIDKDPTDFSSIQKSISNAPEEANVRLTYVNFSFKEVLLGNEVLTTGRSHYEPFYDTFQPWSLP